MQWSRLAEAIKREAIQNPIVADALLGIMEEPVSELLPLHLLELINGQSELISRVSDSSTGLIALLAEPSNLGSPQFDQEEAEETSTRIQFAKSLKILAAGVAITLPPEHQKELGLRVDLTEHASEYPSLLDLNEWKTRERIHSRVYIAEIGTNKLILKERKTLHNEPYDSYGSEPANTSIDEARITQELHNQIDYEGSDIKLSYETPVASVTFKDGYQFALFKYEEGLTDRPEAITELTKAIHDNFELYEDEYLEAKGMTDELNPEEFAELMAALLVHEGAAHLSEAIDRLGYRSEDGSQNMYRILQSEGDRATLEVVGLDSEYHRKIMESGEPYDDVAFSKIYGERDNSEKGSYASAPLAVARVRRRRIGGSTSYSQ